MGDPSKLPSMNPSKVPSMDSSTLPSMNPSKLPSVDPSKLPSLDPSKLLSMNPSKLPSMDPSKLPSALPSNSPTIDCTDDPDYTYVPFASKPDTVLTCKMISRKTAEKIKVMCKKSFYYPDYKDEGGQLLPISDICNNTCNPACST